MAIRYPITLSTTEPNNDVGLLKIRQADEQTQTLVVQLTATSQPKSYEGLQAFFCAKLGQSIGLGIIEQKLEQSEMTNPKAGQLEYTFRPEDWQQIGRQTGYFSFRKMKDDGHEYVEQFTTRDFYFNVTKNVFSEGLTEVKKDGSTYVWTIEDLIRLFSEYISSGKSDWEQFIEDNREILESVDPGGKILNELIDSRGEYNSLADRLDNENVMDDLAIDSPETIKDYFKNDLENFKNRIDKSKFNLLFFTDNHWDSSWGGERQENYAHWSNALYILPEVDAFVAGGDNVHSNNSIKQKNVNKLNTVCSLILDRKPDTPAFFLLGNHDDSSLKVMHQNTPRMLEENISRKEFKAAYRTKEKLFDEVRNGDSLYFYKDFPEKKVRLIGLESCDVPENVIKADGGVEYLRIWEMGYREEQLKWIYENALLGCPEDYAVIITTHLFLSPKAFTAGNSNQENTNKSENHQNHDVLRDMLVAFKTGSFFVAKTDYPDFEVDFSGDFTNQGARKLVGVFGGHLHEDKVASLNGINNMTINASTFATTEEIGTVEEDGFSIIQVDTETAEFNILGFGKNVDAGPLSF